VSWLYL